MDIQNLVKSKLRKEIFRLYFSNPEKKYYLRELERLLGYPVAYIRRELMKLKDLGIFESEKVGNLLYYYLNKEYPLYKELKSIIFKTVGIQGALKEIIDTTKGIKFAFIYGSFTTGRETSDSDIDLIIIGNINEAEFSHKLRKLGDKLQREINYSYYSPKDWQNYIKMKDSFTANVLDEPKIMLKGTENELWWSSKKWAA